MNITTVFSCGDKGWVYWDGIRRLTVGQVRVEIRDSPGIAGESMYDNYKAQSNRVEVCMCVETGIGSGSCFTVGEHIFMTEAECIAANAEAIAKKEQDEATAKAYALEKLLASERGVRRQLAEIEAAKAEQARLGQRSMLRHFVTD